MKKINYLLLLTVAVTASVFTSCKKDEAAEPSGPTISVESPTDGSTKVSGEMYAIKFTISSETEKLKSLSIERKNGSVIIDTLEMSFTDKTSYTFNDSVFAGLAGTETITIVVVDSKDKIATKSISLTIEAGAGDINEYSAKLLGSQGATEGSFFASTTGTVYTQANAKTNSTIIDFLYYYGASNKATIAAPNDADAGTIYNGTNGLQNWSKTNATKFSTTTLTSAQFDAVSDDAAIITAATGASATAMTDLAESKVFAFTTEAGKSGLVKVKTISGTDAGTITIDVKVQK